MNSRDLLALAREDLACYALAVYPNFELAAHHRLIVDKLSSTSAIEGRLNTGHPFGSSRSKWPARSSSCQRVDIKTTAPPGWRRV